MNQLTSRQRKIAYVIGIACLLIPIVLLGEPSGREKGSGGELADLREDYDLGESTLGNVDPSSAAANLVLLGLRGPAASILKLEVIELQKTKNWSKMSALTNTITLLQPHYIKVWEFEGWNLAYNVSQAWDAVEDRYFWVKEGIKFLDKGRGRNAKSANLEWNGARFVGWKVGTSDEWRYFRKYFMVDPNESEFRGGPDPAINEFGEDNFLVAKGRYITANQKEANYGQSVQTKELFRQYPARIQIEYATRLQKEGRFENTTSEAWNEAFTDWTLGYGSEDFYATVDDTRKARYRMNDWFSDDEEIPDGETEEMIALARENFPELCSEGEAIPVEALLAQQDVTQRGLELTNYSFWRMLSEVEMDPKMLKAHRHIYRGKQLFRQAKTNMRGEDPENLQPSAAQLEFEKGMTILEEMFKVYPDLEVSDHSLVEEGLMAVHYWKKIYRLNNVEPPDKFPLYALWNDNQTILNSIKLKFEDETQRQQP
ncbi:MAG: hypothetical protein AB8G99_24580 [Planctomycetaceae bacterium]